MAIGGSAQADICPGPKPGKGIVPSKPTRVQMVSEQVTVHLYRDHSEVVCLFEMRNTGEKEEMEVGFPIMSFELWDIDPWSTNLKSNLEAWVNGTKVDTVEMYIPDELKKILELKKDNQSVRNYWDLTNDWENADKPWHVWPCVFPKDETVWIKVAYTLPNGNDKRCRFFEYFLHTGAGWYGKIGKAVVEVINHDIPEDEIISVHPSGFDKEYNTYTWTFTNLEPTTKDDIEMQFSEFPTWTLRNEYVQKNVVFFMDDKEVEQFDIPQEEEGQFIIDKNDSKPQVRMYTKAYLFNKFLLAIKVHLPDLYEEIKETSREDIETTYNFEFNNKGGKLWDMPVKGTVTNISLRETSDEEKPVIVVKYK